MKRLCIFSFFDSDGIVYEYVYYLLNQIKVVADKLIFVSNGPIKNKYYSNVATIADQIITRENIGFDAGAYKDIIINYLGKNNLMSYDEIILCNDTFFGPFDSFDLIFKKMDSIKCDFWGMNLNPDHIADHIQSFFLTFRSDAIKSNSLYDFFDKCIDERDNDITDAYVNFECGIFYFLTMRGYKPSTYSIPSICDNYRSSNFSIKKYHVPVLKKKIDISNQNTVNNLLDAIHFIRISTTYNIKLISDYYLKKYSVDLNSLHDTGEYIEYSFPHANNGREKIRKIISSYRKIYIYGAGTIAKKVFRFYNLPEISGFVVSDEINIRFSTIYGKRIYHFSDIFIDDNTIFIIALNEDHINQCKDNINRMVHYIIV